MLVVPLHVTISLFICFNQVATWEDDRGVLSWLNMETIERALTPFLQACKVLCLWELIHKTKIEEELLWTCTIL